MRLVATFDPSITEQTPRGTGGSFNIGQSGNVGFVITNDSIYGILLYLSNGSNIYIPAWMVYAVCTTIPSSEIFWVQQNSLSSSTPPISVVTVELYAKGEHPSGTYPTSLNRHYIGNVIPVSTAMEFLQNETNPVGTLIIDVGTVANNNLINIYNDHFILKVLQSGTPHTVLQGNTSGDPLEIGQAGDNTSILGDLTVDGTTFISTTNVYGNLSMQSSTIIALLGGYVQANNAVPALKIKDSAATVRTFLESESNDHLNIWLLSNSRSLRIKDASGSTLMFFQSDGIHLQSTSQAYHFPGAGSLTAVSHFSGVGSGTFATGITNPTGIAFNPCTSSGSSQTIGGTIATSSVVTTGAGLAWSAWGYKA